MRIDRFAKWTPAMREELVAEAKRAAEVQIEQDPDMRELVDWLVRAAGLEPSSEAYQLVFLSAMMAMIGGDK